MAEEIKDLIEKIQRDGVKAGQEEAAKIKALAEQEAKKIIAQAKQQAQEIIEQANNEAKRLNDATGASLKQTGRDLMISIKKEINNMLENLVKTELRQAMTAQELSQIISSLIKSAQLSTNSEVIVTLSQQDKDKLEKHFLKELSDETKKQITLKAAQGIDSGFVISFDAGKSIFDFSAQALTDYICSSLKPELETILK